MTERLYQIVAHVFGVPVKDIAEEDGPDTIESWDSLAHINLVLALEAEFGVALAPEDAAEMLSVGAIRQVLGAKGVTGFEPVTNRG